MGGRRPFAVHLGAVVREFGLCRVIVRRAPGVLSVMGIFQLAREAGMTEATLPFEDSGVASFSFNRSR